MAGVLDVRQGAQAKVGWTGWGPSVAPKTRQVDNWEWNNHLNGYVSSTPQRFACDCGSAFDTPTGFHRCACGKQWNSYVIGTGGSNREASAEKFLVREIPVRDNVIVANKHLAGGPYGPDPFGYKNLPPMDDEEFVKRVWPMLPEPWNSKYYDKANWPAEWQTDYPNMWDEKRASIYKLTDPGELGDEGEDDGRPTMKATPADWHRRDKNQRWTKAARRG